MFTDNNHHDNKQYDITYKECKLQPCFLVGVHSFIKNKYQTLPLWMVVGLNNLWHLVCVGLLIQGSVVSLTSTISCNFHTATGSCLLHFKLRGLKYTLRHFPSPHPFLNHLSLESTPPSGGTACCNKIWQLYHFYIRIKHLHIIKQKRVNISRFDLIFWDSQSQIYV